MGVACELYLDKAVKKPKETKSEQIQGKFLTLTIESRKIESCKN